MRARKILTYCLAGLALTATVPAHASTPASKPADGQYEFRYEAYYTGLLVAEAKTTLAVRESRYSIEVHALSSGILEWFVTFDQLATSSGRLNAAPQAERHRNHNRSRGNWIDLRFADGSIEILDANPAPNTEEGRPPVPAALLEGATDPLSGMLAAGFGAVSADQCKSVVAVYDGRRRYNTVLEDRRREIYAGPAGLAPALVCGFRFERIAGYTEKAKEYPGLTGDAWLQQLGEGLPMLPVRMEIQTKYGMGYIHMVSADKTD